MKVPLPRLSGFIGKVFKSKPYLENYYALAKNISYSMRLTSNRNRLRQEKFSNPLSILVSYRYQIYFGPCLQMKNSGIFGADAVGLLRIKIKLPHHFVEKSKNSLSLENFSV